ncbi:MAG: Vps62-related protein [Thaumarchaeota archaeon]|nr:Vps62-related protein [Nitrososphaerota archaeon]MCL5317709.1 Vps62-related protein [Nitrososphaerota archaeon]
MSSRRYTLNSKARWCSAGLCLLLLLPAIILTSGLSSVPPAAAQGVSQTQNSDYVLATRFAPVLRFTSGEKFYPTSVDYIISNSIVKQRNRGQLLPTIIDPAPTPSTLGKYTTTELFLDNKLGSFEKIAADYAAKAKSIGYYAYVHTLKSSSSTVIQYWLFYAYNNGPMNDHQGDIEVIEVFLDSSGNPLQVLLSQHGSGENAVWSNVDKIDTHPEVYVAQGSHANYFRPYQGKVGLENDVVGNDGITIMPSDLKLVILGEKGNHPTDQSWLDFPGRWGYWGTDDEVARGLAGPLGVVFNQDGIRWASPVNYLRNTLTVDSNYFILAWVAANVLLIFAAYTVVRGAWKIVGIVRMRRNGGLMVGKFLKSRGGVGLILGIAAIAITLVALSTPWYSITASSVTGPLAGERPVELMNIDGVNGLQVNMFLGSDSESSSGYRSLFSTQIPFATVIGAGIVMLALDVIGVKSGKKMGRKFMVGAVTSLIPFVLIYVFISSLPSITPLASQLSGAQNIPIEAVQTIQDVSSSPISGTAQQIFPTVGVTTLRWGFGLGAYLFIIAAVLRIIAGFMMRSSPELQQETPAPSTASPVQPTPTQPAPKQQTAPTTEADEEATAGRYCYNCGNRLRSSAKFCPKCGADQI